MNYWYSPAGLSFLFSFVSLCAMSHEGKPLHYSFDGEEKTEAQCGSALCALAHANPRLQSLCLTRMRLNRLPDFVKRFKQLRSLTLSENELDESIAPVIGGFKHLRYLDISHNRFSKLTADIMRLSHLRELRVAENRVFEIEEGWQKLSHLRSLDLLANDFGGVDESLGDLHDLENVYLDANEIERFPQCLKRLPMLRLLTLTHNLFKSRPKELDHLVGGDVIVDPTDEERTALARRLFNGVVVYYDSESQRCKRATCS